MPDDSTSPLLTHTAPPSPDSTRWIAIAALLRPQGRKGELLAELLTDLDPAEQFRAGRLVTLAKADAISPAPGATPIAIEDHWLPTGKNSGRIVLKLAGCDSISDAELLARRQVMVPASELPTLDADTFYVSDLIGCTLLDTTSGQPIAVGNVAEVEFAMAPDGKTRLPEAAPLLGIQLPNVPADAEPILIPFVRAHLDQVDLATKRILMRLPPGLLDEPGE